jgi:hypothetical protein
MRRLWILFVLAAPFNPGCVCKGNGHVEQTPFVAYVGDNVVNCNCNISFRHDVCAGDCAAHFAIQLCVPPEMRQVVVPPEPDGGAPDGGAVTADQIYAKRMDDYCSQTVSNQAYHLIQVWNGGWCDYKAPFAPQGGIGSSVVCFAHELKPKTVVATTNTPSCEQRCAPVECAYERNCGDDVQDDTGNIHLDKCKCSQVTMHQCPGDPASWLPTPVFCRPTEKVDAE